MSAEVSGRDAPSPQEGYTSEQVRAAERPLLEAGEPLMQRASAALGEEIARILNLPEASQAPDAAAGPTVVVLAGSGDNGGDALFAAARLAERGADVRIVATGSSLHEEGAEAARAAGATALDPHADPEEFDRVVRLADVIVDGILGIGAAANPALRGRSRDVVSRVLGLFGPKWVEGDDGAPRHPLVVAVDVPSGISPDDGSVPDPTVLRADVTVTMGAVKAGLLQPPGAAYAGRIVLVDLGLGPALAAVEPVVAR
ncbi:NAD(P)H-hydrate epimerase [Agromyces arachidis]|uniref:NAD(P)H-hydrate epimerase n=1 Tax=Agromyces arachidis TaxID=766966 RepID=UPI0040574296